MSLEKMSVASLASRVGAFGRRNRRPGADGSFVPLSAEALQRALPQGASVPVQDPSANWARVKQLEGRKSLSMRSASPAARFGSSRSMTRR